MHSYFPEEFISDYVIFKELIQINQDLFSVCPNENTYLIIFETFQFCRKDGEKNDFKHNKLVVLDIYLLFLRN